MAQASDFGFTKLASGEVAYVFDTKAYFARPDENGTGIIVYAGSSRGIEMKSSSERGFYPCGEHARVKTYDEFLEKMNDLDIHAKQLVQLGHRVITPPTRRTPWGEPQVAVEYGPGIIRYDTASHGGIHLSREMNAKVPKCLRGNPWYEEDVAAAIVIFSHPQYFTDRQKAEAEKTVRDYYPDQYEELRGVKLQPGESMGRDKAVFQEQNKDNFVVTSVRSICLDLVQCWAVVGGVVTPSNLIEEMFLVSYDEYGIVRQSSPDFVIDLERHLRIDEEVEYRHYKLIEEVVEEIGVENISDYESYDRRVELLQACQRILKDGMSPEDTMEALRAQLQDRPALAMR